jgi:hypothetical protein
MLMTSLRSPSIVQVAAAAAEAVRELNHRTLGRPTLTGPAELDRLVAELAVMTARLPQLLQQLSGWLAAEQHARHIRSDNHIDPARIVDRARTELADAGRAARELSQALHNAHQHTAHLGARSAGDAVTTTGRPGPPTRTDRAETVATTGQVHGHQRAGFVSARGQNPMSLDTQTLSPR